MDSNQITAIALTAAGTLGANALLERYREWRAANEKRKADTAAIVINEQNLTASMPTTLWNWVQQVKTEAAQWQERALTAEAEIKILKKELAEQLEDLTEAKERIHELEQQQ